MDKVFKLTVHVPVSHTDAVRQALGDAGAGKIGNYSHCSFTVRGVGRFKPLAGANPHIGVVGALEEVEEDAIEVQVEERLLSDVVTALREAHPYEEPAFEIFEMVRV